MKKILKLSLIFSVLALIFSGCSSDEGDDDVANAPKPKTTAVGITIETLSVKRLREVVDGKSFVEFAEIEYKVSGKRQPGTETTHPDVCLLDTQNRRAS